MQKNISSQIQALRNLTGYFKNKIMFATQCDLCSKLTLN